MIIAIVGPTATGKTARAVALARTIGPLAEIISGDSRQVYSGMDVGSGKDLDEYGEVPYHLIDMVPAGTKYDLYQYLRDYRAALAGILSRGAQPIICGGSGLYVESALTGLTLPEVPRNEALRATLRHLSLPQLTERLAAMKTLHNTTDVDTCARAIRAIEIQQYYLDHPEENPANGEREVEPYKVFGIDVPRDVRRARIAGRLRHRLDHEDMIGEVERLIAAGADPEVLIGYGLEYRFITLYLQGRLPRAVMEEKLLIAIHQFAKRQMTWFRGMERRGIPIRWLPFDMDPQEMNTTILSETGLLP